MNEAAMRQQNVPQQQVIQVQVDDANPGVAKRTGDVEAGKSEPEMVIKSVETVD
jgi:hypothetical protein